MDKTKHRVGDYIMVTEFDDVYGHYFGSISNRNFAVNLMANSEEELKEKFERLITQYIGIEAA